MKKSGGIVSDEEVLECKCYDDEFITKKECNTCQYEKEPIDRFGYAPCIGCKKNKNWKQKRDAT